MAKKKEEAPKQKIRIKLKAYDHKVVDSSARQIIEILLRYGGKLQVLFPCQQKFTDIQ
jgi:ribosomal protein S10